MARPAGATGVEHERARRAVFGFLGGAILHETNNVLTVMAGVRQLLKAGISLSDRVGGMIDQQLARMEELVGWIRRLGPDERELDAAPRDAEFVLESVERIVALVGKGRGINLVRAPAPPIVPLDAEAAGLALLAALLPALPERGGVGIALELRASGEGGRVRFFVRCRPARPVAAGEPEARIAEELCRAVGGTFVARTAADEWSADLDLPAGR